MSSAIKKYPETVLIKRSSEIRQITADIRKLAGEMAQVMAANEGIGLAAPQIGVPKRIIVVGMLKDRSQKDADLGIFINPKIVKKSRERVEEEEGCLSLPGLFIKVKRAKRVDIEALDINGKKIEMRAEGLVSRIFQHEIDHLDGVLIVDHLPFLKRWKIKKVLGGKSK